MKVYIEKEYFPEINYVWKILEKNRGFKSVMVDYPADADITITDGSDATIRISRHFFELIRRGKFDYKLFFTSDHFIKNENGSVDFLSTAFYMINTLQEFHEQDRDEYDRFLFKNSYQFKFNCVEKNVVQYCFDQLCRTTSQLTEYASRNERSKVFLSHDVDTIHGSLLQDGFYALKKGRIDWLAQILLRNWLVQPQWLNIDMIMKIESEYDFKSTFFWLVNKGIAEGKLSNSDYKISSPSVRKTIASVEEKGWGNGLHKSISDDSFKAEMSKLPVNVNANRYHYLKFNPLYDYQKIHDAGLSFDSSLGFAEAIGFRNNYGLPFRPFDIKNKKEYNFIECPLNIMDTTYHFYLKRSADELLNDIKKFFEANEKNCILSVLFHNNYVTDYKFAEFSKVFRFMLSWFYEMKFESVTHNDIIRRYT